MPLSCPATAKGTTNKSHHTQKAPQTKAITRSGLPITVSVGVPICMHLLSNRHLLCLCLAQPPQKAPQTKATTRKRHHKQKPPHVQPYTSQSESFRPTHHSQSQSRSPHLHSPLEQHAPLVPLSCPATAKGTINKANKPPETNLKEHIGKMKQSCNKVALSHIGG